MLQGCDGISISPLQICVVQHEKDVFSLTTLCEEVHSYCNTSSLEQITVTSRRDVLEYANKIDAQKLRNWSPAIVKKL